MLSKLLVLSDIMKKYILELEKCDSLEDYKKVIKEYSNKIPPVTKEKHNIWVSFYPDERLFVDVVRGERIEKVIYFCNNKEKTEVSISKTGKVKKEVKEMNNYPKYYKQVSEVWVENFRGLNKHRIIRFNNKTIRPYVSVDKFMEDSRASDRGVILGEEYEDRYGTLTAYYRYIWGMDITKYVLVSDGTYIINERGKWYEADLVGGVPDAPDAKEEVPF